MGASRFEQTPRGLHRAKSPSLRTCLFPALSGWLVEKASRRRTSQFCVIDWVILGPARYHLVPRERLFGEREVVMAGAPSQEARMRSEQPGVQPEKPGFSLEPRLWRYLCFGYGLFALLVNCIAAIVSYVTGNLFVLIYMLVASAVVAAVNHGSLTRSVPAFTVEVTSSSISGPGEVPIYAGRLRTMKSLRQTILLADLDRVRSAKRSPLNRLLGRQYLYSANGERIYLARRAFAHSDVHRLLERLGVNS
jgi:hypothetical protein